MTTVAERIHELSRLHELKTEAVHCLQVHAAEPEASMFYRKDLGLRGETSSPGTAVSRWSVTMAQSIACLGTS